MPRVFKPCLGFGLGFGFGLGLGLKEVFMFDSRDENKVTAVETVESVSEASAVRVRVRALLESDHACS